MKYKSLSIGGCDASGGAGIQADLKSFSATGSYGMTVLTAIAVQNTCGVRGCYDVPIKSIIEQLEAIFEDIRPDAIKIGMLFSVEVIEVVMFALQKFAVGIPVILDPVVFSTSGHLLLKDDAVSLLKRDLMPIVDLVTPNLPEALYFSSNDYVNSKKDLARELLSFGCKAVLLKGGHENGPMSEDFFVTADYEKVFSLERIESLNTHGTGCTLSAAITSFVAQGFSILESCRKAKEYVFNTILFAKNAKIGNGNGPVNHFYEFF